MAYNNPRSKSRPQCFARTLEVMREACGDARPIIFARAISTPAEDILVVPLTGARPEMADMRTVVIVGSSQTRMIQRDGAPLVYTPRSVPS